MICKNGSYIWVRESGRFLQKEDGEERFFGVIIDDTEDKNARDDLQRRAERYALTGLYNREEVERQIHWSLQNGIGELCALFMIDTDNFKQVNDSQGHLYGDEFMIFIRDIPAVEAAGDFGARLLEAIRHMFREDKQLIEVTCSIGVALYPRDGADFRSLYRSADLALYLAKSQGKNQYVLFDPRNAVPMDQTGYSSLGAAIDSDQRTPSPLRRKRQLAVWLNTILDVQDAYIYAVKPDNYELLYLNHKTRELDPEAKPGMTCYRAFFERNLPCENCPLTGGGGEIYNPKYDLWTRVRVAPMKWGKFDSFLLSCFDITEYKSMQQV